MRVAALLSFAAAAAGSPMAEYSSALEGRQSINNAQMSNFKFYAQHAAAAYCNGEGPSPGDAVACSGQCNDVQRNGATIIDTFQGPHTGIAAYVAVDDVRKEIVFSIRGSNNIRNFITDVIFAKTDCIFGSGCKMHTGFADAWNEISSGVTSAIREGLQANPSYKVVSTGHSLGGAVAELGGASLRRVGIPNDIYTFGAPRVGNDVFANAVDKQAGAGFRITHIDDPVPRLPPMIFGYRHTAPEYWLSNGSSNKIDYTIADIKICPGIANIACNAGTFGFDILAHLHYLTDTSGCSGFPLRWKRDDPSDKELEQRLSKWSQQDQDLVANGHA